MSHGLGSRPGSQRRPGRSLCQDGAAASPVSSIPATPQRTQGWQHLPAHSWPSWGFSVAFLAVPVGYQALPEKPRLREGVGGGRRPRCVLSESLMPWRPKKDTRRTPFHANWHCLQATKDSLYQFHPVACRERLRGDLPAWLWGSPNSRLLLLPRHGGGKTNPKRKKKPKQNPRLLLHMLPGKQTSLFLPLPHVLPFRFCFTCKQTW